MGTQRWNVAAVLACVVLALFVAGPVTGRGGRGGGGGGGARPSPSFSRPSPPAARPTPAATPRPSVGTRPDIGPRPTPHPATPSAPNFGGGNRPNVGNYPGVGSRPQPTPQPGPRPPGNRPQAPGAGNRPGYADRPVVGQRPNVTPRPDHGTVRPPNRPTVTTANIAGGHNTVINRPVTRTTNVTNVSRNTYNRGVATHVDHWGQRWNHNFNYSHYPYRSWYHGSWSGNWYNHWGVGPVAWGLGAWALTSLAYTAGTAAFANPYYVPVPIVQQVPAVDYSQPIPVVVQQAPPDSDAPPPPPDNQGMQAFDRARAAFKDGDYAAAEREVNRALVRLPNEPVLHEFRALVLFAEKKYQECAATLEALLAVTPGWDWTTMSSLYPDVSVYQDQLRALEKARNDNPRAAYLHFVLAYHYLTLGYPDAARTALEKVVALQPNDRVASQLLQTLAGPAKPTTPPPAAADIPLDVKGTWKADGAAGAAITLSIKDDGKFQWSVANKGKAESFGGTFTLDGDVLMLERSEGGALMGRVTPLNKESFNFRIVGSPPSDPGLTFKR